MSIVLDGSLRLQFDRWPCDKHYSLPQELNIHDRNCFEMELLDAQNKSVLPPRKEIVCGQRPDLTRGFAFEKGETFWIPILGVPPQAQEVTLVVRFALAELAATAAIQLPPGAWIPTSLPSNDERPWRDWLSSRRLVPRHFEEGASLTTVVTRRIELLWQFAQQASEANVLDELLWKVIVLTSDLFIAVVAAMEENGLLILIQRARTVARDAAAAVAHDSRRQRAVMRSANIDLDVFVGTRQHVTSQMREQALEAARQKIVAIETRLQRRANPVADSASAAKNKVLRVAGEPRG
jgi:hypothetical protein